MICVDNHRLRMRVRNLSARWSHLISDSDNEKELLAFAKKLGLKPGWIQRRPQFPTVHFDVTDTKRMRAIKLGAKSITCAALGQMIVGKYQCR